MKITVCHLFYECNMKYQHESLEYILREHTGGNPLAKGEVAVFLNNSWTACKVLAPGGVFAYMRQKSPMTVDDIRRIPQAFGGPRLDFTQILDEKIEKAYEERFGERMVRLRKVVGG